MRLILISALLAAVPAASVARAQGIIVVLSQEGPDIPIRLPTTLSDGRVPCAETITVTAPANQTGPWTRTARVATSTTSAAAECAPGGAALRLDITVLGRSQSTAVIEPQVAALIAEIGATPDSTIRLRQPLESRLHALLPNVLLGLRTRRDTTTPSPFTREARGSTSLLAATSPRPWVLRDGLEVVVSYGPDSFDEFGNRIGEVSIPIGRWASTYEGAATVAVGQEGSEALLDITTDDPILGVIGAGARIRCQASESRSAVDCGATVSRTPSGETMVRILATHGPQADEDMILEVSGDGLEVTPRPHRIRVRRARCVYAFLQATYATDQLHDGETYYLVGSSERNCLLVPISLVADRGPSELSLASTDWTGGPELSSGTAYAAMGSYLRLLRLRIRDIVGLGGSTIFLQPRFASGRAVTDGTGGAAVVALDVSLGFDADDVTVELTATAGGPARFAERVLGIGYQNNVSVQAHASSVPWIISIPSGAIVRRCGGPIAPVAAGRQTLCLVGMSAASAVRLNLSLSGTASEMGIPGRPLPPSLIVGIGRVTSGRREVSLDLPVRRVRAPWALQSATIECADGAILMTNASGTVALERSQYHNCSLVVPTTEPVVPDCRADYRTAALNAGVQIIDVESSVDGITWFLVDQFTVEPGTSTRPSSVTACGDRWVFSLRDLAGPVAATLAAYTPLHIRVSHHIEVATDAADFYTLSALAPQLTSMMQAEARLFPGSVVAFRTDPGNSHGFRFGLGVLAGLSVLRYPSSARSAVTSSAAAGIESVDFQYGVLIVGEVWDFARNEALIPFVSPQIHVGVMLPTDFNLERPSFVLGIGLRLPTSTTPGSAVDVQLSPAGWLEMTEGANDLLCSFLLGLNIVVDVATSFDQQRTAEDR